VLADIFKAAAGDRRSQAESSGAPVHERFDQRISEQILEHGLFIGFFIEPSGHCELSLLS
jgi:hypothetical protein